ncbi:tyrosine-type recombinase/integrase [Aeoliella mucimassa]|uniref:Phage integrase family protein n=1 Tax=Aeoliella mucimassa TaxID=2527972 RepID=A0A518ALT2_9BACT|nr:tyrosine-type recombinase/integrase [Aeoliella mucimassa]QDU55690.1 Phage integrase family protein [Aeoliella mucimassa]
MAHSSNAFKPEKPRADFPLFPHQRGYWAKKVRGKLHYFGKIEADPKGEAALEQWLDQKDYLLAGRKPRTPDDGCTVMALCNAFLTAKTRQREAGELSPRTFKDYHKTCDKLLAHFGKKRLVDDLQPEEFGILRAKWSRTLGAYALAGEVQQARTVFKFGYDNSLIDRPVRFGSEFKQPSKKAKRVAKQTTGERMLEAEQLQAILKKAKQPLHAMILLGVNCGFGNFDVASLSQSAVDLQGGWIDFPRSKTAIPRRCPLWPETVTSLKEAIAKRPEANHKDHDGLCFLTRYGNPWGYSDKADSPLSQRFRKLLEDANSYRHGISFYVLRHVFQTIAGDSRDPDAVRAIMGHIDNTMSGEYRERIPDDRLRGCVNVVRAWLFPNPKKRAK